MPWFLEHKVCVEHSYHFKDLNTQMPQKHFSMAEETNPTKFQIATIPTRFHFCMYKEWVHEYVHHWCRKLHILKVAIVLTWPCIVQAYSIPAQAREHLSHFCNWSFRDTRTTSHAQTVLTFLFAVSTSNPNCSEEKENLVLSFSPKQIKHKLGSFLIQQIHRSFSNSCGVYTNMGEGKARESEHMKHVLADAPI